MRCVTDNLADNINRGKVLPSGTLDPGQSFELFAHGQHDWYEAR